MTRRMLVLGAAIAAAAGLGAVLTTPGRTQAYQCRAPQDIAMPDRVRPDGPSVRVPIAGYTLAISWSPEFCRGGKAARDPENYQCNGRIGRFGFVLHGLWPEGRNGAYPQWCSIDPQPSRQDYQANLCMTPAPWLMAHEWAKHGSCMVRTPESYFRVSRHLWQSLRLPDADRLSRRPGLTAGDLRREFVTLNPDFPAGSVGMVTANGGWLREMHLCYGKDFMPTTCSRRAYGPRDDVPLKVWRGL